MARILVGVTGSVAAYKAVELVRLAIKAGHSVRVLQTEASLNFVGKATFESITGAPVLIDEFERDQLQGAFPGDPKPEHSPINHLELVERADIYLIAPASANTIAKLASGVCDSFVTTAFLASTAPVVVAPAMNSRMWANPATRENVARLKERGVHILEPREGELASKGEQGVGRLVEPPDLLAAVESLAAVGTPRGLDGTRVLISAGGTREAIDSVRYIGNRSSGRMGLALAEEALRRGARVEVVAANVALPRQPGIEYADAESAEEMHQELAKRFESCDILIMAAAVADYRPKEVIGGKIKKKGRDGLTLGLQQNPDILAELTAKRREGQVIVGFAAEYGENAAETAREKLTRKGVDMLVVNDISRRDIGFDSYDNQVIVVTPSGDYSIEKANKGTVAAEIWDLIGSTSSEGSCAVSQ